MGRDAARESEGDLWRRRDAIWIKKATAAIANTIKRASGTSG